MRKIWLAGGCFWGVEGYFQKLKGILDSTVGYGQGNTPEPTYKEVCSGTTGYTEVCEVVYNESIISLQDILDHFFRIIDPTTLNRQGNDRGPQYRSGIFYDDEKDLPIIDAFIDSRRASYRSPIVVEVQPFRNFYPAEEYHQDYLAKNPGGYCHVDMSLAKTDERN